MAQQEVAQQQEYTPGQRAELLENFKTLPAVTQSSFLQEATVNGIAGNALAAKMEETIIQHRQYEQQQTQIAALKQLLEISGGVQAEVQQGLAQGKTGEQIKAEVGAGEAVKTNLVTAAVQEHKEAEKREQVAIADEVHREKVGLTQPEQAQAAHPFAGLAGLSETMAAVQQWNVHKQEAVASAAPEKVQFAAQTQQRATDTGRA